MRLIAALVVAVVAVAGATGSAAESPDEFVRERLSGDFVGEFYYRRDGLANTGVLLLGGAEGGLSRREAKRLASDGYPTLAMAYFKAEGLPERLEMVPLEYFDAPIEWLTNHSSVESGRIVVFGGSKGAELALLLASRDSRINGVVALAPSSVVWQGIPDPSDLATVFNPRSSWSAGGEGVPFVPYDYSKGFNPNDLLTLYRESLTQEDKVRAATIPVEDINGPVLLFSGKDDRLWPSTEMGEAIVARLSEKQFAFAFEHTAYEDAGHVFHPKVTMLGGTEDGNSKAQVDSDKRLTAFLQSMADYEEPNGPTASERQ
ncbi:MAG: acyl-CoA thioester hydrolase/BAAT C-terminal domain-containing protein [Planctomycetota bacterium]|jgi:dienelactone hydrolase